MFKKKTYFQSCFIALKECLGVIPKVFFLSSTEYCSFFFTVNCCEQMSFFKTIFGITTRIEVKIQTRLVLISLRISTILLKKITVIDIDLLAYFYNNCLQVHSNIIIIYILEVQMPQYNKTNS